MEEAFRTRLLADAAVVALSAGASWFERPPKSTLPWFVLTKVSTGRVFAFKAAVELERARVRVDCYGRTVAEAKALSRAAIPAIEPAMVVADIRFAQSFLQFDRDMGVEDIPGGVRAYRVNLEFFIWWSPI